MSVSLAIDIALLLPGSAADAATEINRRLDGGRPGGLTLDATHLPHITLVQLFVAEDRLGQLFPRLDRVAANFEPLEIRVRGLDDESGTAMLALEENDTLLALHAALMETVREFEVTGGAESFFTEGDLPARERDVAWVAGYRADHSGPHFVPHVTVGHGSGGGPVVPFAFRAARLAACHLGRYCTCRRIVYERCLEDRPWQDPQPTR